MKHRVMLHPSRDDVLFGPGRGLGNATNRQVVALCSAAGEDDLIRLGIEQMGQLLPGIVQQAFGFLSEGVNTGGVTVSVLITRKHGFQDFRRDAGCRIVIEIDLSHCLHSEPLQPTPGSPV